MEGKNSNNILNRTPEVRVKGWTPALAWNDPPSTDDHRIATNDESGRCRVQHSWSSPRPNRSPPFYDREALQERLDELRAEKSCLLSTEESLRERLCRAERILSDMRSRKRELSVAATVLDGVAAATRRKTIGGGKQAATSTWDGMGKQDYDQYRSDTRARRQKQLANASYCAFDAKDDRRWLKQ